MKQKSVSTIRREIRALQTISADLSVPDHTRDEAYEAYHALRWSIEDVSWRVSAMLRRRDNPSFAD